MSAILEQSEALSESGITVSHLSEAQKTTVRLIEDLRRASTPDSMKKAVERLKELETDSNNQIAQYAKETRQKFEERIEDPSIMDKIYEKRHVIMAAAGILTLGAWLFRKSISKAKLWGMTAVAAVTGGYFYSQASEEESFLKKHQGHTEPSDESTGIGSVEVDGDSTASTLPEAVPTIIDVGRSLESLQQKSNTSYTKAAKLAEAILNGEKKWSEDLIPVFQTAINDLDAVRSHTTDLKLQKNCSVRIGILTKYMIPPQSSSAALLQKSLSIMVNGQPYIISLLSYGPLGMLALNKIKSWLNAGTFKKSMLEAIQSGNIDEFQDIVGRSYFGAEKYGRLKVAQERIYVTNLIAKRIGDMGELVAENRSILTNALKNANRFAVKNFFDFIAQAEDGEKILNKLLERPDQLKIFVSQGGDMMSSLQKCLKANPQYADDIVDIVVSFPTRYKLKPQVWDDVFSSFIKQIRSSRPESKAAVISTIKTSAPEVLAKRVSILRRLKVLGITLEIAAYFFYLYEASEIEEMIRKMERYADSERLKVLHERVITKKWYQGGLSLASGLGMLWMAPSLTIAGVIVALQLLYESAGNTASQAAERRTRSPQAWASERTRDNLIKLWCLEKGVSDGDWISANLSWIPGVISSNDETVQLPDDKTVRKKLLTGILLQSLGVKSLAEGKPLIDEIESTQQANSTKSTVAQIIIMQLDYIESLKPNFDPKTPMEANRLLTEAHLIALLKKDQLEIQSLSKEVLLLYADLEVYRKKSKLYKAFQAYISAQGYLDSPPDYHTLAWEFQSQYYPQTSVQNLRKYEFMDLPPDNRKSAINTLLQSKQQKPEDFMVGVSDNERTKYQGLLKVAYLKGAVLDRVDTSHPDAYQELMESVNTRKAFEMRMDEMYTLLALRYDFVSGSSSTSDTSSHMDEIEDCYNFCTRYYEAVYGLPYQSSILLDQLTEDRVYAWVLSLSQDRSEGISFTEAEGKGDDKMAEHLLAATTDREIRLNANVTRKISELGILYNFARTLGYQGQMDKIAIQNYFSIGKALDHGFYYDNGEWHVVRIGTAGDWAHTDESYSAWLSRELSKMLSAHKLSRSSGLGPWSVPNTVSSQEKERLDLLCRAGNGTLLATENNPLIIDFLEDAMLRNASEMFEREDDKMWMVWRETGMGFGTTNENLWRFMGPDPEKVKEEARIRNIGEVYSGFLWRQKMLVKEIDTKQAKQAFETDLTKRLETHAKDHDGEYLILSPDILKTAYLAGYDNVGLFAYKIKGNDIHAWQIGPLPDGKVPEFISSPIDNPSTFAEKEFGADLLADLSNPQLETARQDGVINMAKTLLKKQVERIKDNATLGEKYTPLNLAVKGIVDDFDELQRVVYDKEFDIRTEHYASFTARMRRYISLTVKLLFQIQGSENLSELEEIFELRRQVNKLKQLYLIAFLHEGYVDNAVLRFLWIDTSVGEEDDWKKIDTAVDRYLDPYSLGELYKDYPEVKCFYEKAEGESQAYLMRFPDSLYKEEYRDYYLRQISMLIHMAQVYGFDDNGQLKKAAPSYHPRSFGNQEMKYLENYMRDKKLDYPRWLSHQRGITGDDNQKLTQFDSKGYVERYKKTFSEIQKHIQSETSPGEKSIYMTKSMMIMCLCFDDLVNQIKLEKPSVTSANFGLLNTIYEGFGKLLQHSLSSNANLIYGIKETADFEKAYGYFAGEGAEIIQRYYSRWGKVMKNGVQLLSEYLAIDSKRKGDYWKTNSNPPITYENITRAVASLKKRRATQKKISI